MKVKIKNHMNKNELKISKDSNGSYYKSLEANNENLLLHTFFVPTSSLQRKNLYSLSLLSSYKILSSSLDLEKNRVLNNRFHDERKVA
ncbi:hypothetical protein [Halarcobacter ebronensis]|uniref:Uncharacterized protein n=1 Tax=Halarcobacter ebronensis TaxID=1462615 RepID=A0A4Q1ANX7_9BACT|nr:hypothetical protein [Halarcobacter ebronensis]QKF82390.1 hypothetical protein AEBR_1910 [Halarcobacter ebronensis]RXK07587.1 hypothetical protein CRV07_03750 [Halarcobacter ebronensis]